MLFQLPDVVPEYSIRKRLDKGHFPSLLHAHVAQKETLQMRTCLQCAALQDKITIVEL